MSDWDDEELTTIAPYRFERSALDAEEEDDRLHWSRASRKDYTPPPGLSRRQRRKYRKAQVREAREEQRDHNRRVASRARGQVGDGFGWPLLAVAIVVALLVFHPWHRPAGSPAPSSTPPAPADTVPTPSHTPGPTPTGPIGYGADTVDGTNAPAELTGAAGSVAYRFLLAFDTYDPAYPAPISTWSASWGRFATPQLTAQASQLAPVLWGTLAQSGQSSTGGAVTGCTPAADTGTQVTWECDVTNNLFPVGGDAASPYSQQRFTYRVVVAGSDTADPRVDTVALLGTGDITPATAAAATTTAAPTTTAATAAPTQ